MDSIAGCEFDEYNNVLVLSIAIKDKKSSGFVVSDLFSRYIMNMKTIHKLEYNHPSMGSKAE